MQPVRNTVIDLLLNLFIAIFNVVITPTNTNNSCHDNKVICTWSAILHWFWKNIWYCVRFRVQCLSLPQHSCDPEWLMHFLQTLYVLMTLLLFTKIKFTWPYYLFTLGPTHTTCMHAVTRSSHLTWSQLIIHCVLWPWSGFFVHHKATLTCIANT